MSEAPIPKGKGPSSVTELTCARSAKSPRPKPSHGWWRALVLVLGMLSASPSARAEQARFDEICRALADDGNYKVRLQAAIVLGKLRDQRALPCLTQALSDSNKTVRAMAANALGQVGDAKAVPALQALRKADSDAFVRSNVDKALGLLASGTAVGGGPVHSGARLYVTFGAFTGGAKSAGPELAKDVRDTLAKELGKTSSLAVALAPGDDKGFQKQGLMGFFVDGNITRVDETPSANGQEVSCAIKVMVARWPSRSIISWTSAEASLQAGSRPKDRENAHRDCLEATAGQLAEDLAKFFKAQGG